MVDGNVVQRLVESLESGDLIGAKNQLRTLARSHVHGRRTVSLRISFDGFWDWPSDKIAINASKLAAELWLRRMANAQLRKVLELAKVIKEQSSLEKKKRAILKMYTFIAYQCGRRETKGCFELLLEKVCPLLMEMLKDSEEAELDRKSKQLHSFLEAVVAYFAFFGEGR